MTTATRPRRLTADQAAVLIAASRPGIDADETAAIPVELLRERLVENDGMVCQLRLANFIRRTRRDGR